MELLRTMEEEMIKDIMAKKEAIILERIYLRTDIKDFEGIIKDSQRLFPKLKMVCKGEDEYVYYNDGSENGLLIVVFKLSHNIDFDNYSATLTIKYE